MTVINLDASHVIHTFSPAHPPVLEIESGSTLTVETMDSYNNRFHRDTSIERYLAERPHTPGNPATGPIYIRGVQPGDGLDIHIEGIQLTETGYIAVMPGIGVMGDQDIQPALASFYVREGELCFGEKFRLPLRPNIGTIGVAPREGTISSLELGRHGGNLDCNEITTGATLHLPVQAPGGLLAIGDVHARMGYGEVYSGVNIAARVTMTVERVAAPGWKWPWLETDEAIMTIGIAADIEGAVRIAVSEMTALLMRQFDISLTEAIALTGAACDLRPGQTSVFGRNVSMLAVFPKHLMR